LRISGRTHQHLVGVYGARWKDVTVAFFHAYIDDSGTDPSQQVANATALIIPSARIPALESEWNRLRVKEGFSYWHTAEFAARNPKSEFAQWSDVKHQRVFRKVRAICKKYCVQPMSFSVFKKDYDEVVLPLLPFADKHHYSWAIRSLLSHTEKWRHWKHTLPLEYIFSWMGEKRKNERRREIEDILEQAEEESAAQGNPGEFEHWAFRRPQEIPALQCADALAWTVYQYGLLGFCKRPLCTDARIAWDDFGGHVNGKWGFDVTITRAALQKWAEGEAADGRSERKLKAWKERKYGSKCHEEKRGVPQFRPDDEATDERAPQRDQSCTGRGETREAAQEKAER
jgi:hypothetical protein